MKKIMLTIALCFILIPIFGYCDELTLEKKTAIKELLQVSGTAQMGELMGNAVAQQIVKVYKKTKPDINPRAFNIIEEEIIATFHEEIIEKESFNSLFYPIYHKHLTLEELFEIIRFYKTTIGRKLISLMPILTQEGMEAGKVWGGQIAPLAIQRVEERLKKEGIKLD